MIMFGRRRLSIYGLIISVLSVLVLFDRFDSVQGSLSSRNPDNDNVLTETRRHNRRQETRNEEEATIDAAVKKQRRLLSIPGFVITKLSTGGVAMFRFTRRQYKTVVDSTLVWTIGVLQSIQDRLNKSIDNNKIHEDNNPSTEQKQETKSNIVVTPSNNKSSVPANQNDEPIVVVVKHEKVVEETNTPQDKTTAATIGSPATLRSGSILPKSSSTASSMLHNNNNSKNKNKLKAIVDKTGTASASSSSSSVFDAAAAPPHAIILDHDNDDDTVLDPEPSYLGSFFPTLMTGLVFATAGTMSYLWNGDWTETASSVASYFWGTAEDATTDDIGGGTLDSSSAIPVTPDKY